MVAPTSIPPIEHKASPKKVLILITAIFLSLGFFFLTYQLIWGQYREHTTDAYVQGNMVMINSQIVGTVSTIYVDNTQLVEEGQKLLELDPTDATLDLNLKKAELGESLRRVVAMFAKVEETKAEVEIAQAELTKAIQDFEHRQGVLNLGAVTIEDFEHSQAALASAAASLIFSRFRHKAAEAQVKNTTVLMHPLVIQAKQNVEQAWVNLKRCTLLSPVKGIVAKRKAQVGERMDMQTPAMAVVPLDQIWVEANFTEKQLSHVRIDQPVKIRSDFYGGEMFFYGKVVGLEAGTGNVFSLLPPQNATGNWIKIVQRLPVRIEIPLEQIEKYPLRLGLSLEVTIDTHNRKGKELPSILPTQERYTSDIYSKQMEGVEELIAQIIEDNVEEDEL